MRTSLRLEQEVGISQTHLYGIGRRWGKGNIMDSLPSRLFSLQRAGPGWLIVLYLDRHTRSDN